jgi:hypothetical protein
VPKVDADGNELGGIASLLYRLPLGTYTGWNPIPAGALKGRERSLAGGYIPFAKTKAERLASGDSRPSLEERYRSHEEYVQTVGKAANELVHEGYLMQHDAEAMIGQARASEILR